MTTKNLNSTILAIIYLLLPILLFFLFWLRWYYGIPASLLLCYATYKFIILTKEFNDSGPFPPLFSKENICVSFILFIFLLLCGHGMFMGGTGYDTPWRNATYYDLMYQSWPVIYEYSHSALIYYLTYWLVPAGIGSILGLSKVSANIVLFIWSFIGLRIFISLLFDFLKAEKKQLYPLLIIFFLWSGLNSIGMTILSTAGLRPFFIDSEWGWNAWQFTSFVEHGYAANYMIRTTFDSLANIYHQFIPMLLCTILFLRNRNPKSIIFLSMMLIPFSPLGAIGLCLLTTFEMGRHIYNAFRQHQIPLTLKNICSSCNLFGICSIVPVFYLYFTANNALEHTNSIFAAPLVEYGIFRLTILILFYLLYFIIFMDLCKKNISDHLLFYSVLVSLMILPLFKVGRATDFGWNASMPAFYIVMVFMMQEVLRLFQSPKKGKHFWITMLILFIAFTTPCLQMASQFKKCYEAQSTMVYVDFPNIGDSFSNKPLSWIEQNLSDLRNFENPDYKDKLFYKYLSPNR